MKQASSLVAVVLLSSMVLPARSDDASRPNVLMIIADDLYDNESDPHEWTNLAERPELAAVKAKLAKWLPETDAPSLRDKAKKLKNKGAK